ncbi:angio-associated migratory cell protein-like protein [Tanacetum coccineum]
MSHTGDDKGFLWKIGQGDWAFELQGHKETVSCVPFSFDGQLVASGSLDGVIQVWDISLGNLKYTLDGPGAGIKIAQAWRPVVKGLGMLGSVKALGRGYGYLIGVMIFTPVAILTWFPMFELGQLQFAVQKTEVPMSMFKEPLDDSLLSVHPSVGDMSCYDSVWSR